MLRTLSPSSLELIQKVDTWPYYQQDARRYNEVMSKFFYFMVKDHGPPLGYIHSSLVEAVPWPSYWHINREKRSLTLAAGDTFEERTALMRETFNVANSARVPGMLKSANEPYAVYTIDGRHLMDMEVLSVDSFGVIGHGVHLIAYVKAGDGGLQYWVQRRTKTKSTFPSMLDSTAAGNLLSSERPLDGIVREAAEEAGISEEYTRANIISCGTISYHMSQCNDGRPGSVPQAQFNFELELQQSMVPRPVDGEVDEFLLLNLHELWDALSTGKFKPNIVMTYIAHLVRHGYINAENERDLSEVCARLHRKHDLFIVEDLN